MIHETLTHPLLERLTVALLHFLWQGVAIAAIWKLVVWQLRNSSPQTRYLCGTIALCLMSVCPIITFILIEPTAATNLTALAETSALQLTTTDVLAAEAETQSSWNAWILPFQPYIILAWLFGTMTLAVRLLLGYAGTLWLRSETVELSTDLQQKVASLSLKLGWVTEPVVVASQRVTEAITVGFLKPMVLLPSSWLIELSPDVLEAVIAHEMAHIRRFDLWINLLQRMVETILFYHPAVWWISNQVRVEREFCCDQIAVRLTGQRVQYAQSLEEVARRQVSQEPALLATPFLGDNKMTLLNRVRRVLGLRANQEGSRLWPIGLVLIVLPMTLVMISTGYVPWNTEEALAGERGREHGPHHAEDAHPGHRPPPPRAGEHPGPPPHRPPMLGPGPAEQELLKTITEMREEMTKMRHQMDEMRQHMRRMEENPPPPPPLPHMFNGPRPPHLENSRPPRPVPNGPKSNDPFGLNFLFPPAKENSRTEPSEEEPGSDQSPPADQSAYPIY